jgi:hypothetical protein
MSHRNPRTPGDLRYAPPRSGVSPLSVQAIAVSSARSEPPKSIGPKRQQARHDGSKVKERIVLQLRLEA